MALQELIPKLICFIKRNGVNIKRLIKLIGFVAFVLIWYKLRGCKKHDSIVCMPHFNPIIGHISLLFKHWTELNEFVVRFVSSAGWPSICSVTSFNRRYILLILDPSITKFVFDTKFESFIKGPKIRNELYEILGDGIFTSDPPKWAQHRKAASRMFSMRNLKDYMFECTVNHTKKVIAKIEDLDDNNCINIYDMLSRFTLDCFTAIAFGKSVDSLSIYPAKHPFAESFDNLMHEMTFRHFIPHWIWKTSRLINTHLPILNPFKFGNEAKILKDVEVINSFSDKILDLREQYNASIIDETGDKHNDVLSLFIKHSSSSSSKTLSRSQLKYIAMNMIIAGRDTTRLLLSWFLYEMCQRSEILKKIYAEIDEYNVDNISYNDINKSLFYLESVLLESLRMNPVVPFLVRHAIEDVQLPNGNIIHKNDEVIIPTYAYGRNPKIYKNPETFDPDRFYNNLNNKSPINVYNVYQYPFFNINPRLCLGRKLAIMESKVFIFYFFKQYHFKMADTNQNIKIKTGIVLNMQDGLRLKLTKRTK